MDSQITRITSSGDLKFSVDGDDGSTQTLSSDDVDNYDQCSHLAELFGSPEKKSKCLEKYKSLVVWSTKAHLPRRSVTAEARPAKRRKIQVADCDTCGATLHRPFVCLFCNFGGCWKEGHVVAHMQEKKHGFCVDTTSGNIFCLGCDDFVQNANFDSVHSAVTLAIEEKNTGFQESKSKNKRVSFKPWTPTQGDNDTIQKSTVMSCQGRRGLLNLGSTCYMNVILQTFIHNPLLRNHFLSDKHPQKLCKNLNPPCLCCEMDKLFSELYSGSQPYGPVSFLHAMWKAAAEVSGYQQQDAHEFFIAALNQIHASSRGSTSISCVCVVHSTFAGQLQSDVQCTNCGNVTTQTDLVLDITLDLGGKLGKDDHTLAGCLRRFTRAENLESRCSKCVNSSNEATKRLSIRKLPPVLCFTFKRFKHDNTATKIDTHIRFPANLNMAPYTSIATGAKGDPAILGPPAMYEYELFAVVNHEGQVNTGHYTNYARFEDQWYHFNDEKVTSATLRDCLNSRAYMCVYVKRHLDYKQHQIPSYILAQQQAAERDRMKGGEKRPSKTT
ncbi:hypothetical protein M407DRAFT_64084 [Tulasnella calospora MUT 4182]|uniref:Ubiquitin carboxyl-terminal hydrolase n=1 Tax=Tulasnella calospora MUT 4182 TaxID=1051891 RepID=A0A0C3MLS6_9AGAM|nr:hypothetical protein M407DRAFT_64084 [Tulasnella calospora MUT 4182]